ncbi:MAG: ATP-binding protein [Candidatus Omnitrophica bacterium]|nr:ATP-binding protein [Candidatus Omnitrophota bacterium]
MKNKKRFPIHIKITFLFVVIFALSLFALFIHLNRSLREHTLGRIKTSINKELKLSRTYIESNLSDDFDVSGFDSLAEKISADLGLRVTIVDRLGVVRGDSELTAEDLLLVENHLYRPEVQDALSFGQGLATRFSSTIKKRMLYVAEPYYKNGYAGIIRLSIPLLEVETISNRLNSILFVSLLFCFVLSLPISYILSLLVSKPIRQLSLRAKLIAEGDFSKKALIVSGDEIGDLNESFNLMIEEIQQRMDDVTTSRSRLEAVLLSMSEGVMAVDLNGNIILMNQALKEILELYQDPVGKKPIEVLRNIEVQDILDQALKELKGIANYEITLRVSREKKVLINVASVVRNNNLEGLVFVFHDISELRQLEKVRQDFVANVSHELRTPITSIKGYAETLLNGALDDKENVDDFLKIIHSDADRLAALISDILDLSKIESGKVSFQIKSLSLKPVIERVINGTRPQIQKKGIKVTVDIGENLPEVLADDGAIGQVILNLVDNAIKYNKPDGEIFIKACEKGKFVEISVTDSGIGIPKTELPRIFERFYRVDKARSCDLGGTGLGLSIVKHIILAHNGKVWVESTYGQGTSFTFSLPKS